MSIISEALKKAQWRSLVNKKRGGTSTVSIDDTIRRRRKLFFPAGVLAIALFFLLFSSLIYFLNRKLLSVKKENIEKPPYAVGLKEIPEEATQTQLPVEKKAKEDAETYLSPSPQLSKFADINKSIALNGIMYTHQGPLAVINDAICAEGDTIGEFEILEIGKDFVKVSSGEQEFVVKLEH